MGGGSSWSLGCLEEQGLPALFTQGPPCLSASSLPCQQIELQRTELQSLRDELQRQKELWAQEDPQEALSGALSDREEAVNK